VDHVIGAKLYINIANVIGVRNCFNAPPISTYGGVGNGSGLCRTNGSLKVRSRTIKDISEDYIDISLRVKGDIGVPSSVKVLPTLTA